MKPIAVASVLGVALAIAPLDAPSCGALHLVVQATKLSCRDEQTGATSRRAFQLLHKLYPRSPWSAKTPYWFAR